MILPGRLAATTLGDLLGQLHRGRATGILELVEDLRTGSEHLHRVFLNEGLVDAVDTPLPAPRLGELLLCEGALSRAGLLRLSRLLIERPRAKAGRIVLEEQLSSASAVRFSLHRQLRLRVDALFHVRQAAIRFHVRSAAAERDLDPLDAPEFLHGRPRARGATGAPERAYSNQQRAAFQLLGLDLFAGHSDVQRAFRTQALLVHPDRHPNASPEERAHLLRQFAELSHAYHLLLSTVAAGSG